jgi:hypothetical protein
LSSGIVSPQHTPTVIGIADRDADERRSPPPMHGDAPTLKRPIFSLNLSLSLQAWLRSGADCADAGAVSCAWIPCSARQEIVPKYGTKPAPDLHGLNPPFRQARYDGMVSIKAQLCAREYT